VFCLRYENQIKKGYNISFDACGGGFTWRSMY